MLVISNPTNLNGSIGFIGTRRFFNNLSGQDQGDNGKEVNMVVHFIASRDVVGAVTGQVC